MSEMLEKLKNSILKNSIILKTNNLILKFIYIIIYIKYIYSILFGPQIEKVEKLRIEFLSFL